MTEEIKADGATTDTSKYRKKKKREKKTLKTVNLVKVTASLLWSFPHFSQEKEVKRV